MLSHATLSVAILSVLASASPTNFSQLDRRKNQIISPYAPTLTACPANFNPIRAASGGVNPSEAAWATQRKNKASSKLRTWLAGTGASFPTLNPEQYPTIGLVDGGGGFRGFLMSAGVHKAFDSNERTKTPMSGLYQAITYESGLSGSSASLASYASDNWPTTSSLQSSLWETALNNGVLNPEGNLPLVAAGIAADVAAKAAGYPISVVDAWARLLPYSSLQGDRAGVAKRYSDILTEGGYTQFLRPYPIITAIGVEDPSDGCGLPRKNATQYEFTPHEFGSWEKQVGHFMETKYLGTAMHAGKPTLQGLACTTGFDNTGWVMATSTNIFNQQCANVQGALSSAAGMFSTALYNAVSGTISDLLGASIQPLYSLLPNPFLGLTSAPAVQGQPHLLLIDGGETIQVPPIWPFLYRPDVSVLFVSDNSADNPTNYAHTGATINLPSGIQLRNTYLQAQANGVGDRMPFIPYPPAFQKANLNKRTVFFGCNAAANSPQMTIIYLPNRPISFNSDQDASRLQYDVADTRGMIGNGVEVATDGGAAGFDTCVGCAVMKKAAAKAGKALPAACAACFKKYCYN